VSSFTCPVDVEGQAVQYLLRRLSPDEEHAYQTHILTCVHCSKAVGETAAIIQALRDATEDSTA
jgi:hypothetical protein